MSRPSPRPAAPPPAWRPAGRRGPARLLRAAAAGALLAAALGGCGGGGTDPVSGLFYTGTQAAADLSKPEVATALLTEGYAAAATLYALAAFHHRLDPPQLVDPQGTTAELSGSCPTPGTATLSYRVDLAAGTVSGEVLWQGYCVLGRSLSGRASFAGSLLPDPSQPPYYASLHLDFGSGVAVRTAAASYRLEGALDIQPGTLAVLRGGSDLFQRQEETGEVSWIKDFEVKEATDATTASLQLSQGAYFDPRYGGADLRTLNLALQVPLEGPWPVQGQLEAANGTGLRAVLTADPTGYTVAIYAGDKLDQQPTSGSWSSLAL